MSRIALAVVLLAVTVLAASAFVAQIGKRYPAVVGSNVYRHSLGPAPLSMVSTNQGEKSMSTPAKSFLDCVKQAVSSTKQLLDDGEKLIEVEFPPLPLEYLDDSASSARDIADANTRWSVEFALSMAEMGKISIVYPDQPELEAAIEFVDEPGGAEPYTNVTLGTIRTDSIKNAESLDQVLLSIFGATVGGTVEGIEDTKMYIAVVSSTQELPDLEKLHNLNPDIPIVFFNLRLDILRGDLGLPLFPGRDLHHRFLCKIKPSYLMRDRSYATSLRKPPFIVNYSGLLYRAYPEPYQNILNTGDNTIKVCSFDNSRPTNMGFRKALTDALVVPGVTAEELKGNEGNLVWWEKEMAKESSDNWRS